MTKLKISFIKHYRVEHLEAMAQVHGYKAITENPDFNSKEPESEANPKEIKSKITAVEFAIKKLAEKTGAIVTHEVTYPIMDELSPKDLQSQKQTDNGRVKQF